jgi:hypothetical protein
MAAAPLAIEPQLVVLCLFVVIPGRRFGGTSSMLYPKPSADKPIQVADRGSTPYRDAVVVRQSRDDGVRRRRDLPDAKRETKLLWPGVGMRMVL